MSNKINNSNVYKNAVMQNFELLKKSISIQEAYIKAILIEQSEGCLLPFCKAHAEDKILLTQIFEWQKDNNIHNDSCIVKRDEKSGELTISSYLITLDEILFLIVNNSGKICEQVGFKDCFNENKFFQLCNFFIHSNNFDENLMVSSINSLINWASKVVNLNGLFFKLDKFDHKSNSTFEKAHFQKSKDNLHIQILKIFQRIELKKMII